MSTRIHGMTLEQFDRRVRNLPAQIQRASLRLANLKTEARRYGLHQLAEENPDAENRH